MNKEYAEGLASAVITLLAVSFHPIITRMRNRILDPLDYAFFTVFFEMLEAVPLFIISPGGKSRRGENFGTVLAPYRKYLGRFILIGLIFAGAQWLFYIGFETADAVLGSIALKSAIIFTLISGALFLKEKTTPLHIFLTGVIFVALIYTISGGTWDIGRINIGAVILVFVPLLWTIGHSITKPLLKRNEVGPAGVILFRTIFGSIILAVLCFYGSGGPHFGLLADPVNFLNVIAISVAYLVTHYTWYISLKKIGISLSSAIQAPQPILTTIFATSILAEHLEMYHIIGLTVIVSSLLIIILTKKEGKELPAEAEIP